MQVKLVAIDKVAASLREFGWRQPIVVETEMTVIVGGVTSGHHQSDRRHLTSIPDASMPWSPFRMDAHDPYAAGPVRGGIIVPAKVKATCCIAGGGPAGLMLGLLLARAGVDVVVLEKHADFLRDFRGDTIHPSTMHISSVPVIKEN